MGVIDRLPELQKRLLNEENVRDLAEKKRDQEEMDKWEEEEQLLLREAVSLTVVHQTLDDLVADLNRQDRKTLEFDQFTFRMQKPDLTYGLAGEKGKDKSPTFQWLLRWDDTRNPFNKKTYEDVSEGYGRFGIDVILDVNQRLEIIGGKRRELFTNSDPTEIEASIGMAYLERSKIYHEDMLLLNLRKAMLINKSAVGNK